MLNPDLILALCVLAHAAASRLPNTRGVAVFAGVVYVFALVLVAATMLRVLP